MGLFDILKKKKSKWSYSELVEWQNLVGETSRNLVYTEKQLTVASKMVADRAIQITNDCISIVNSSKNPDTFFYRLQLLDEKYEQLSSLEKYISFAGDSPRQKYIIFKSQKTALINGLIDRMWADTQSKIDNLKTDKAKDNARNKFLATLHTYESYMRPSNIDYYKSKVDSNTL